MASPNYHCTQQQLYTIARTGWKSCGEFITQFTDFKPKYTMALVTDRFKEITIAEELPDLEQRDEDSKTFRVKLRNKATDCQALWQRLKRYITDAYPEDELTIKLDAAGQQHYRKASQDDWNSVSRLMVDGDAFITANTAELQANDNMPPAFATVFNSDKSGFEKLYQDYLNATQNNEIETQTKINANNEVHAKLMSMFLDGQEIFKNDEAVKKLFTFDQVLQTVAGSGTAGARGEITDAPTGNIITAQATLQFTGPTNKTVTSDSDARYEASPLAAGTYTVTITCPGYQTQVLSNVEIQTGVHKNLDIALTPAP